MKTDSLADYCVRRMEMLSSVRASLESDWNDIRDLVRPVYAGYNRETGQMISHRSSAAYDGTAPNALEELSSALHSYLTNPTERWFELEVEGDNETMQDPDALLWLEEVSDIIYSEYSREDTKLIQSLHETYLDVASFGTACLNQEWSTEFNGLSFSAKPIRDCFILENSEGHVDTLFRRLNWSLRQIRQEFGEPLPPKLAKETKEDKTFEVIHGVFPRTDRRNGNPFPSNKKFVSCWVCVPTKELLKESGYDTFPYHVPRWTKLAGEVYGRSPAQKCLPDIRMLNSMEKTLLKAGQKIVDPPLVIPNEGFLLPIKTSPGAIIYKEPNAEQPEPLVMGNNLPWGLEQANQKREFIRQCFYADWIRMEKQNIEMTAYEVADRREEKLRLMAPMLGRLVSELQGPMIKRSYFLLNEHGRIPTAPGSLSGKFLKIGYSSPAARAQLGVKAVSMGRYLAELIPMAQVNPGIMDAVDLDKYAQELARARGVPRIILRSPDEIAAIRQSREQQQAVANAAQIAEPATKAIKNLADAQAKGMDL